MAATRDFMKSFDVLVIGGGHAGMTAAICAAEAGARVCVLEAAPRDFRGGNSRHTRNLRAMHIEPTDILEATYTEDEYYDDLLRVTGGNTDDAMARLTIRGSGQCVDWLRNRGVQFQPPLSGTLHLGRTNAFFLGGGRALLNALYRHAERLEIVIHYDARVTDLVIRDGRFEEAVVESGDASYRVRGHTLVAAAGGFEANFEWLESAWGPPARNFLIRGTPWNRGDILRILLDNGVQSAGQEDQCHAVAIDGRAPKFDGGIVTRVDCVPFGVVVNKNVERFHDEGEDFWPKRYAIWGQLIARQPDQVAWVIIDNKANGLFMPPVFPPETADTVSGLAVKLGLDPDRLSKLVGSFNDSVRDGTFDHTELDDCHTLGQNPEKSHWARRIDTPPYSAWPLRPGITFTYLGVAIDETARIRMADGTPSENMFATGEIMAGNVLGQGYLAGIGMTIGNVFGRLAGEGAARHVRT